MGGFDIHGHIYMYSFALLSCSSCVCCYLSLSLPQRMGGGDSSCAHYARAEGEEYASAGGRSSQGSAHSGSGAD